MEVQLLVKSKTGQVPRDYIFPLNNRVVLGRSPESPVPLEGSAISREHLVLELVGNIVYATDLSNNGTWINGNRLKREQRTQLEDGDSMELPDYEIRFQIQPAGVKKTSTEKPQPHPASAGLSEEHPQPATIQPVAQPAPKAQSRSLSFLDLCVLFFAVLAIGLMIYYAVLVP